MNTVSTRQGQLDGQLVVTDNQGKHSQYKAGTIRQPTGCNR